MKKDTVREFENPEQPLARNTTLTKAEVAVFLRITVRTLDNWMRDGLVPYYKIGKLVRFHTEDVMKHLEQNARVKRGN